ncbi:hypothetical protein Ga0100231_018805 [Opitutaceae bacterium TAV4]|nr:hypothetical protein Ga0100231_018805 [Opitutaceae bacterium TAV4]RRK00152.1 hypothetical protein Ga0100230_019470 [Opitutaceae bacterium TAV3]
MSRSRRRTPCGGITTARSEKSDKQDAHRRLRTRLRSALARQQEQPEADSVWPGPRDVSDPWAMAKDGKCWFDPRQHPNLMRK